MDMEKFRVLGLSEASIDALRTKGFEEPTDIQSRTIPLLLDSSQDIIAQAQTGTGKTAAFGLVFMERLEENSRLPQALVVTPTRELAIQVAEEISSLCGKRKLRITPIYGGQSIHLQLQQLKKGVDIIIGTPGRVLDHLRKKTINLSAVRYVVLDEADEMLNMGFIDDVETILAEASDQRQLLLFSATMPKRIKDLAARFMNNHVMIHSRNDQLTTNMIDQIWFEVKENDKFEALCRIVDMEDSFYGIVFCRTRLEVDKIATHMKDRGYASQALHGDVAQAQREHILNSFRKRKIMVLIATDVASRGIDVNDLTHVINYSLPQDPEAYVHRIGRTGRAGKSGTAITFVTPSEYRRLSFIKKAAGTEIRKERIPNATEIIAIKKTRIKAALEAIITDGGLEGYHEFVSSLLVDMPAETALAALIKHSFRDELEPSTYREITEARPAVESSGKTRLFITMGRKDKMSPKKLVDFISKESGISQHLIQAVEIFDAFSFITVPFQAAESILQTFKKRRQGNTPMVKKAEPFERKPGGRPGGAKPVRPARKGPAKPRS